MCSQPSGEAWDARVSKTDGSEDSRWTCSATPCGPRASTTRPTSTTTSPPASATTGRDSTAACGAAEGRRARRLEARPARPQPRPPVNTVQDLSARGVGLRVLAGDGAQIDTTTAAGRLVFGIFAALDQVRAGAGLKAARARGRKGGRKFALTKAQVRLAQAAMGAPRHVGVRAVPGARHQAGPQG